MKNSKLPTLSLALQESDSDSISKYAYTKTKIKPNFKMEQNSNSSTVLIKSMVNDKLICDLDYNIQTLRRILQFRNIKEAPVDTMGCDQIYDEKTDILSQKFQILVSIMLSLQTKDQITYKVVDNMIKQGILHPKILSQMKQEQVQSMIKRVNYHKTKAKNIILAAQSFVQNGAPKTFEDVIKFKGVGTKVGTLYMKTAEGENIGIGTDTHVHRISNKLGWVSTKNPESTQQKLRQKFPKEHWTSMNHALVGFGQLICNAKNPKCHECPVSDRCPSSNLKVKIT